jgi:hypothetical protein
VIHGTVSVPEFPSQSYSRHESLTNFYPSSSNIQLVIFIQCPPISDDLEAIIGKGDRGALKEMNREPPANNWMEGKE